MEYIERIEKTRSIIQDETAGKRVLFITTKELDYIRNTQEIRLLQNFSESLTVIGSKSHKYPFRLLNVYWGLLRTSAKKYDLVFIGFAPQLVLPFWEFKFRKNRILIDFFISMYDTFVNDRKRFARRSLPASALKSLDQAALRRADLVICDTDAHGSYFAEELGARKDGLLTLYLEADRSVYYPHEMKRPEKLKDQFVVLYFGSVLPLQGVDIVLEAYNLLKDEPPFYLYMIGPVGKKYKKPEGRNIEYIEWLPQSELSDYIAMADLCLAGHFNSEIEKASRTIPGKAYIYDAMGKNMILGDNRANRELFEKSDTVFWTPMGDPSALAAKIRELSCAKKTGAQRSV